MGVTTPLLSPTPLSLSKEGLFVDISVHFMKRGRYYNLGLERVLNRYIPALKGGG